MLANCNRVTTGRAFMGESSPVGDGCPPAAVASFSPPWTIPTWVRPSSERLFSLRLSGDGIPFGPEPACLFPSRKFESDDPFHLPGSGFLSRGDSSRERAACRFHNIPYANPSRNFFPGSSGQGRSLDGGDNARFRGILPEAAAVVLAQRLMRRRRIMMEHCTARVCSIAGLQSAGA